MLHTKTQTPHEYFTDPKDPHGKSQHEAGAKLDAGKAPVWQGLLDYFPLACQAIAEVSQGGAVKYAWKGWESVPNGIVRYRNAQARHIIAESIEGPYDSEGFRHLAQNAWNALAVLELTLRQEPKETK
jgi:hypothetical protein